MATVFLFQDLTEGKSSFNATYCVTCPYCQHHGEYEGKRYLQTEKSSPKDRDAGKLSLAEPH